MRSTTLLSLVRASPETLPSQPLRELPHQLTSQPPIGGLSLAREGIARLLGPDDSHSAFSRNHLCEPQSHWGGFLRPICLHNHG